MYLLRTEYNVKNYDAWRKLFESDPIGREKGGVISHRVMRAVDNPEYVLVDLEFADAATAKKFHAGLVKLWSKSDVMINPTALNVEVVDEKEY